MIVEPRHFEYLVYQRGGINRLRDDFITWKAAYDEAIENDFKSILPILPPTARTVLDVGGGLSGLGARINQHYGGRMCVAVLDGKATPPTVGRNNRPHNNATITQNFLRLNGVHDQRFFAPEDELDMKFDIVVSTQAWCFHIEPSEYLDRVDFALAPNASVALDVRKHKEEWMEEVTDAFGTPQILLEREKWQRLGWRRV